MKKTILFFTILFFTFVFLNSQDKYDPDTTVSKEEIAEVVKSVQEDSVAAVTGFDKFVEDLEKIEGLFNFYKNSDTGEIYLELLPEQLEKDFLCTVTRQTGDAYIFDASAMLWNFVFYFQKINKKVQMLERNLAFRSEEPALRRALDNSFTNSIIASSKQCCKEQQETGAILIKADDLFLKDLAQVEATTTRYKMRYNFDKDNSYFSYLKSFPLNTELEVILHYYNTEGTGAYTLPDSRSMLHRYHYSISTIPNNNYRPRLADDRIGLFTTIFQDYTDLDTDSPYVRYVNRWHLEKEKPDRNVSKVKEPIVFWLENTIPVKYRKAVKEGILAWNEAFEKAGLKDAIVVKEMPDDADWDPADSRYNTIRWIIQPGSGYAVGPSHVNPYTGQIYDADVRISVDFLRYYYREFTEIIETGSWIDALNSAVWKDKNISYQNYREIVTQSQWMGQQLGLGSSVMQVRGLFSSGKISEKEFVEQGIKDLVMHEVGHTLGLRHNFKASTVFTLEQLQDENFTKKHGIISSIMDYTPINLAPLNGEQGSFFQGKPGYWDLWVIAYGYTPFTEAEEEEKLAEIASRCTEPLLAFGTDGDAFGMSTRGVDPSCNIFDLSNDPINFYTERIKIAQEIWDNLLDNFEEEGESYQKLLQVFSQGLGEYSIAAHNVSKFVGGLYTYRDHIGDPEGRPPFVIVPAYEQRRALQLLTEKILAPDAFNFSPDLLNKLVYEKMGTFTGGIWSRSRLDYPIHSAISNIQATVLSHLYDPLVLSRLVDNELRFSSKEEVFRIDDMFSLMDEFIWQELTEEKSINSFRRELQRIYTFRLIEIMLNDDSKIPQDAVALSRFYLNNLTEKIEITDKTEMDRMTAVHLSDIKDKIQAALTQQYNNK
ncbi:MAG: hypothetical protein APR54_10630 [Candidatus Cloacimonas sp. SDB]|nr:MAG: hypothetical protein APR54_10630 [Candidatus Cloacimonas sp. SDB]